MQTLPSGGSEVEQALHVSQQRMATEWIEVARDYLALTKPGIVVWLMITAFCAMVVASRGMPGLAVSVATLGGLALSAGGAHAVNMWYDRDIDQVMERTKNRPVVTGRIPAHHALIFGVAAGIGAFVLQAVVVNWMTAVTCLGGYLVYVFVYTVWLKRRSPQNIVIGGAAGAFPPLVGWAAITNHVGLVAGLMFLLIFLWTPPHFWSLALYKQNDYRRANIPMMPIVKGYRSTSIQTLGYTVLTVATSLALFWLGRLSWVYLAVAMGAGGTFLVYQFRLLMTEDKTGSWAKRNFKFSLIYIAVLFFAMVV